MVSAPRGFENMPGVQGGQMPVRPSPNIPQNYQFLQNKAQPGQEFNATTGELSYKAQQPDFFSQYLKMQGLGGMGGNQGVQLPAKDINEAKQRLVESGENPADYKFTPVYSTGKGGFKAQTGITPELDPKLQETRVSNEKQGAFIKETAQDTLSTIAKVKDQIGQFGLWGGIPKIPGTKEFVWQSNIDKLLSGKVVELITTMKSASKTGATGFGQLSDREGQILREASTALKKGLPPEEAMSLLNTMEEKLNKVIEGGAMGQPQGQEDFSTMSDEELRAIAGGQ
jgi:hypothetical protein